MSNVTFTIDGVPNSISFPERLVSGLYNIACSAIDLVKLVMKVALAIFATLLAGICFGQSKLMNHFHRDAWEKEVLLSGKMLVASLKGIFDPIGAYTEKLFLRNPLIKPVAESGIQLAETMSKKKPTFSALGALLSS